MKITTEQSLSDFEFWSGALPLADRLTEEQFDAIEQHFEEINPDGMDETEINDMFWHDSDYIAQIVGYDSYEDLIKAADDEEE